MTDSNLARRTDIEVTFDGVDITEDMKPYLLSLSYSDKDEGETDDIQIVLQDRDEIWLKSWLNEMVGAAAEIDKIITVSKSGGIVASGVSGYGGVGTQITSVEQATQILNSAGVTVTSSVKSYLQYYMKYTYKYPVTVKAVGNGYVTVTVSGSDYKITSNGYSKVSSSDSSSAEEEDDTETVVIGKLKLQAKIIRRNWNGDGKDLTLDCGQFELDEVSASGPPATINLKGTSLPYSASIRQATASQGWESYSLKGIASEIASRAGLQLNFLSDYNPYYSRVEQYCESNISFLSKLCQRAGISLKCGGNQMTLFQQIQYEAEPAMRTITKGDGSYSSYKLQTGSADTQYQSCRVSYVASNGRCISGTAYIVDYDAENEDNQQLEVTAQCSNQSEAEALAQKYLRLHNKYEKTGSFTFHGDPALVAGCNIELRGFGMWNGKYAITESKHTVSGSGYQTSINIRKTLEGY